MATDRIPTVDLAAIRARHTASTPGAWRYEASRNNGGIPLADFYIPGHNGGAAVEMMLDDAVAIVEAHNHDIQSLLDEVERLRRERDGARFLLAEHETSSARQSASLIKELEEARSIIASQLPHGRVPGDVDAWAMVLEQNSRLRAALGYLRRKIDGCDVTFEVAEEIAIGTVILDGLTRTEPDHG